MLFLQLRREWTNIPTRIVKYLVRLPGEKAKEMTVKFALKRMLEESKAKDLEVESKIRDQFHRPEKGSIVHHFVSSRTVTLEILLQETSLDLEKVLEESQDTLFCDSVREIIKELEDASTT